MIYRLGKDIEVSDTTWSNSTLKTYRAVGLFIAH